MSEAGNSSLAEKSRAEIVSLLSPEEITKWRDMRPEVRTGTACMCGAHNSTSWVNGGQEWFAGHVLEHHVDERKHLAKLAMETMIFPAPQDSYTVLEVEGLLGDQRNAIARAILGLGPESDETLANA